MVDILRAKIPASPSENLVKMTIHDLLTMSAGYAAEPLPWTLNPPLNGDLVRHILAGPVDFEPGTEFVLTMAR